MVFPTTVVHLRFYVQIRLYLKKQYYLTQDIPPRLLTIDNKSNQRHLCPARRPIVNHKRVAPKSTQDMAQLVEVVGLISINCMLTSHTYQDGCGSVLPVILPFLGLVASHRLTGYFDQSSQDSSSHSRTPSYSTWSQSSIIDGHAPATP